MPSGAGTSTLTLSSCFDRSAAIGSRPSSQHVAISSQMDSKKLAQLCWEYADNKKAENIVTLDVSKLSSVADYFVICSGTSEPHLRAISDEILNKLRDEQHLRPRAIDGTLQTAWIVLDYFDVIVHVMKADVREKYDLEALWGDAPRVKPRKARAKTVA
jgi:ribosome-associated protein